MKSISSPLSLFRFLLLFKMIAEEMVDEAMIKIDGT